MSPSTPFVVAVALLLGGCSSGDDDSAAGSTIPADTAPTADTAPSSDTAPAIAVDVTDACSFLSRADFAGVGFTVAEEGEDVSENFNLSTTSSVACQWMNDDDNISSSWELVIGTGDAEAAFASDLGFAQFDTVTTLEIGDESFLADKVSSFDSTDHDFEAGVRIGDIYFTMSTTDDRGAEAIVALANLVVARLNP